MSAPGEAAAALAQAALVRRRALLDEPELTALRLLHGAADGCPGLVVERLGDVLIAQLHEGKLAVGDERIGELCRALMAALGARAVYRKSFPAARARRAAAADALHADPQPWLGSAAPAEFAVREGPQQMLVHPYDGFSTGVFLEQRENRRRVRAAAAGKAILNLFSYTGGFSVAGALGGARTTVSVDISKRFLDWSRRNFAANGLPLDGHLFIRDDARKYLRRAARQDRRFDLIVIDPPTFARVKGGDVFELQRELPALLVGAIERLTEGASLLLSLNQRDLAPRRVEQLLEASAAQCSRSLRRAARLPLPPDFPGDPDYAKAWWIEFE